MWNIEMHVQLESLYKLETVFHVDIKMEIQILILISTRKFKSFLYISIIDLKE